MNLIMKAILGRRICIRIRIGFVIAITKLLDLKSVKRHAVKRQKTSKQKLKKKNLHIDKKFN